MMSSDAPTFLTHPSAILRQARSLISSPKPVDIAIAFWGRGAVEQLGLGRAGKGTRILMNAKSGACNPDTLEEILALSQHGFVQARCSDSLHAKVVIGDSEVLVGSANASANGLGFQATQLEGWDEACVSVSSDQCVADAKSWYEARWFDGDTYELTADVIETARQAWKRRRKHLLAADLQSKNSELVDLLEGRSVYVVMSDKETSLDLDQVQSIAREGDKSDSFDDFYENWSRMPKDAVLLHLYPGSGSGAVDDGFWLTPEDPARASFVAESGLRVFPVLAVKDVRSEPRLDGLDINVRSIRVAAGELLRAKPPSSLPQLASRMPNVEYSRRSDWCMSLYDFVRICRQAGVSTPEVNPRAGVQQIAKRLRG